MSGMSGTSYLCREQGVPRIMDSKWSKEMNGGGHPTILLSPMTLKIKITQAGGSFKFIKVPDNAYYRA